MVFHLENAHTAAADAAAALLLFWRLSVDHSPLRLEGVITEELERWLVHGDIKNRMRLLPWYGASMT